MALWRHISYLTIAFLSALISLPPLGLADDTGPAILPDKIIGSQFGALAESLPPELRDALSQAQRSWVEQRDKICTFELKLGQMQPRTRVTATEDGRDANCLARLNTARLQDLQNYLRLLFAPNRSAEIGDVAQSCRLDGLGDRFEVHAVGARAGLKPLNMQLASGNQQVREAQVIVNKPGVPVVLVLMGNDTIVWRVSRTPGSQIAAVIVGGNRTQILRGLPSDTPKRFVTREGSPQCGPLSAYQAGAGLVQASARIKVLTGRDIDSFVTVPRENRFIVGSNEGIKINELIETPE
jgi:hypothetical protein